MARQTKEEVIQELQKRNIEFDGGATLKDLTALLSDSQAKDGDVNAPGATNNEDKANPIVPSQESPAVSAPVLHKERCWNCYAQDRKTKNLLDENGECAACGFVKDLLYNGTIEADKAAQRVEMAQAAERGE